MRGQHAHSPRWPAITPSSIHQLSRPFLVDAHDQIEQADAIEKSEYSGEQKIWWTYYDDINCWRVVARRSFPTVVSLLCYSINEAVNVIIIGHTPDTTPATLAAVNDSKLSQNFFNLFTYFFFLTLSIVQIYHRNYSTNRWV